MSDLAASSEPEVLPRTLAPEEFAEIFKNRMREMTREEFERLARKYSAELLEISAEQRALAALDAEQVPK